MDWQSMLSLAVFAGTLAAVALVAYGIRRIPYLRDQPVEGPLPRLSVVIAARDEAATIEPALRSLLNLDYPALEIVVVDDRSTDATGTILQRMTAQEPRLRVIQVRSLPPDWLGKTHALHLGAAQASGEFLLFTDADVLFAPDCLARAVSYAQRRQLDHLVVFPDLLADNRLLRAMLVLFVAGMIGMFQPWRVTHARRRYIGIGAFNLVRARKYREAGGHAPLALAPLDDLMLGKLLKRNGARADALFGQGLLAVAWYRTPREMILGLEKNIFSGFDYSFVKLTAATAVAALMAFWPVLGLFLTDGAAFALNLATIAVSLLLQGQLARRANWSLDCLLYLWPAQALTLYTWWRAALRAQLRQEIEWRGTRYPLAKIKARHF